MENGSRIEVLCYAGSRADETPRAVILEGREIAVRTITDRWVEEGVDRQGRRRCFKIICEDGLLYTIHCEHESGKWYLDRTEIVA